MAFQLKQNTIRTVFVAAVGANILWYLEHPGWAPITGGLGALAVYLVWELQPFSNGASPELEDDKSHDIKIIELTDSYEVASKYDLRYVLDQVVDDLRHDRSPNLRVWIRSIEQLKRNISTLEGKPVSESKVAEKLIEYRRLLDKEQFNAFDGSRVEKSTFLEKLIIDGARYMHLRTHTLSDLNSLCTCIEACFLRANPSFRRRSHSSGTDFDLFHLHHKGWYFTISLDNSEVADLLDKCNVDNVHALLRYAGRDWFDLPRSIRQGKAATGLLWNYETETQLAKREIDPDAYFQVGNWGFGLA